MSGGLGGVITGFLLFCSPGKKVTLRKVISRFLSLCSPGRKGKRNVDQMDLRKPSLPISFPLTSLEQLDDGALFTAFHYPFLRASVQLAPAHREMKSTSKLLVCHDMKGGYQDDRFVQGDDNATAYSLWHWQSIDIFVYFSHSLVTIPPPSWTNAAHSHGVKILGTFITEWDEGAETCKRLLETKDSARTYAWKLAEISQKLGFDGWLINIENKIDPAQIPTLESFIRELTVKMHELVPGSLVIWYDAVTVDGELRWQNMLNEKNQRFFDACDGIFVNYTWEEDFPGISAKTAGDRAGDVYMGVDVFGRNTYGGGGYQSDVALRVALKSRVSAALFAPGWVYETKQGPTFEDAQTKFWASIDNVWPIAHRNPVALPFFTDFSQGFGTALYSDAVKVSARPWSNLSFQTLQPLLKGVISSTFEVSVRSGDPVYSGGSHTRFMGKLGASEARATQLYSSKIVLTNTTLYLEFSAYHKTKNSELYIALRMQDSRGTHLLFFKSSVVGEATSSWNVTKTEMKVETGSVITGIFGVSSVGVADLNKVTNDVLTGGIQVEAPPNASSVPYEVYLGHLRMLESRETNVEPAGVASFEGSDTEWSTNSDGKTMLSMKLTWKLSEAAPHYSRYDIFVQQLEKPAYLGTAFVEAFYVNKLVIEDGVTSLQFRLQPYTLAGYSLKLDQTSPLLVHVPGPL